MFMARLPAPLLALLMGVQIMAAAPRATDEILSALQTRLENNAGFEDLLEQLNNLEPKELARLQAEIDAERAELSTIVESAMRGTLI